VALVGCEALLASAQPNLPRRHEASFSFPFAENEPINSHDISIFTALTSTSTLVLSEEFRRPIALLFPLTHLSPDDPLYFILHSATYLRPCLTAPYSQLIRGCNDLFASTAQSYSILLPWSGCEFDTKTSTSSDSSKPDRHLVL
jgi:hypothetical protein